MLRLELVGGAERGQEGVVFGLGERGVEVVVAAAFAVAGGAEQHVVVERIGGHDRSDGVEKSEGGDTQALRHRAAEGFGRERARGDDARRWQLGHLTANHGDPRVARDARLHRIREHGAVHRER